MKKIFPLNRVYTLLASGPVIMVSTAWKGKQNAMPMSWHMMMEFEPPLVGVIISDANDTYRMLKASRECVINIPTVKIAEKTVACGNVHGSKVDKFEKFGLTPKPASVVGAPLIDECYANVECKMFDTGLVNTYGLFVLEVVKAWIDPAVKNPKTLHHLGKENFFVAGKRMKIKPQMK